jgi:hypothetical protein
VIIKGGSRKNRGFFAHHFLNRIDNDKVRVVEFKGLANEDVSAAFLDMEAMARGTRCENYFYQASLSPRQDERLTDAQWSRAVDTLERHLGFEGQPRFVIEHEKEGRVHRHVVWSRIDADTMTALSDSLTYRKHEAAAREIERDCGLEPVASVLVKDRDGLRPERRPKDYEGFRGSQTGLTPEQVQAEVTALWLSCDSGASFRTALEARGYILCRGDTRDFCIIDPAGDEHSLARRIAGVNAPELRERMADIDRGSLPTVAEGREFATAWGESESAAARTVQEAAMAKEARGFAYAVKEGQAASRDAQEREGWEYAPWSPLERAAHEYGQAVKNVARAGQDAYWQAFIGGKPRTEADKLAELMWGEKEPEPER